MIKKLQQAFAFVITLISLSACTSDAFLTGDHAKLVPKMDNLLRQVGLSYFTILAHQATKNESGSGFMVDTSGHMLTAGHVGHAIGNKVEVRGVGNTIYTGKVIAVQHSPDIALLKINKLKGKPVTPVSQPCIAKGSSIFSIGNPKFGKNTVRIGRLTSVHYNRFVNNDGFGYPDAIEVNLGTLIGESGGPLFTEQAKLAGMMVSSVRGQKRAHAIPSNMLAQFLCANSHCSTAWQQLAKFDYQHC